MAIRALFSFGKYVLSVRVGVSLREMATHVKTLALDTTRRPAATDPLLIEKALEGMGSKWIIVDKNKIKVAEGALGEAQKRLAPLLRPEAQSAADANTG